MIQEPKRPTEEDQFVGLTNREIGTTRRVVDPQGSDTD